MTPIDRFVAALPAGEWAALRVLTKSEGEGVMMKRDWALLAEAVALRHGGREAFLKCIVAASDGAGDTTRMMTARQRLERVRDRLEAIAQISPPVPLVEILECRFLDGFDALLIAMERVTTLRTLIEEQKAGSDLALQVLHRLAPATADHWHHVDVCPRNVGVTRSGNVVYIDVESLYLSNESVFELSNPFGKWFRLPVVVCDVVGEDLQRNHNRMTVGVGAVKQAFDLALLAAECSLNGLPPFERQGITEAWLRAMVDGVEDERRPLAEFWAEHLRPAVESGAVLDLVKLASNLASFVSGKAPPIPPLSRPKEDLRPPSAKVAKSLTDFDRDWQKLQGKARALRRDALTRAEVELYRQDVASLAQHYPQEAEIWSELLLILISYQRDRNGAHRVAHAARQQIPHDANLHRMYEIVTMWAAQ